MGTIIKNTTSAFVDGQQITSDALNNLIDDAILNTTAVSAGTGLTVNASTGVLSMDTSLTGKTLTGGSLNNCPIGASTPSTGAFTTLTASGDVNFDSNTLFVDASTNNVGIGSSAPDKLLVVAGAGSEIVIDDTDATDTPRLRFRESGSTSGSVSTDAGELIFDSGTTERMRIDSSGNVGIGTESPQGPLHVVDGTATGQTASGNGHGIILDSTTDPMGMSFLAANTAKTSIFFGDTDSNASGRIEYDHNGDNLIFNSSANTIFFEGSTERLRIDSGGNVGIGTESPSEKLHVKSSNSDTAETVAGFGNGDIDVGLQIKTNGNGGSSLDWGFNAVNSRNLVFDTNQNERMRITSSGNVGIGTALPNSALEVSGNGAEIIINDTTTSRPQLNFYNSGSSHGRIYASGFELRFETSGNGMRLDPFGNVGIGTTGSPNSILEISSTTSGVIMPRMNTTEMNAISSPTNGEMIYNTSVNKFYGYANGSWVALH